jgi:uncharacterized protein (TIGR03437 family)
MLFADRPSGVGDLALFVAIAGVFASVTSAQQVITTYAGTDWAFVDDGKPGVNATLAQPVALATDSNGNVYIADPSFGEVIKLDTNGVATIFAGTGIHVPSGDGGLARAASLKSPMGVAVDSSGAVYISDTGRIRKVTPDGIITTFAGNSFLSNSGDGGSALLAGMSPSALAFDTAGNLYVVSGQTVRRIDTKGIITTVAGTGVPGGALGDGGPAVNASIAPLSTGAQGSILIDSAGGLLIADTARCRVRRVDPNTGIITTVAGNGTCGTAGDGGPATSARLNAPTGLALDGTGGYYVSEAAGAIIRRVDAAGIIRTVAGTGFIGFQGDGGSALQARLATPYAMAADSSGGVYFADRDNARVRKFTLGGAIATVVGIGAVIGDGGAAADAKFIGLGDVQTDAAGNTYLRDGVRIRKVTPGGIISTIVGTGRLGPAPTNGTLATDANLIDPTGVTTDLQNRVVFEDFGAHRIYRVQLDGTLQSIAGSGAALVGGAGNGGLATAAAMNPYTPIRYDNKGNLYYAEFSGPVRVIGTDGIINAFAGGGSLQNDGVLATQTYFNGIGGLAPDNAGNVYISEQFSPRIRKVDSKGIITTVAGTGVPAVSPSPDGTNAAKAALGLVGSLAFSPDGTLTFVESTLGSNRIRAIAADGTLKTIAGSNFGFSGDGGLASAASFAGLGSLAYDSQGNLLAADPNNQRIREVPAKAVPLITLSQKGLTYLSAGGATPQPQSFTVVNGAAATLNFSITVSTQSGGNWLSTSISNGIAQANAPGIPVTVAVDPSKLSNGDYYGLITVIAPGVPNSPQSITVVLRIAPTASIPLDVSVLPGGFIFTATANGSNPAPQTLTLSTLATQTLNYTANVTYGGLHFLTLADSTNGTVSSAKPVTFQLQPQAKGLAPGVYDATITIAASTAPVKQVRIFLIVAPVGSIPSKIGRPATGSCQPTRLLPVSSSLVDGFRTPASYPIAIVVLIADDCGNAVTTGTVKASFTTGDAPIPLTSLQDGSWSGTWQPRSAVSSATVTIDASTGPPQIVGSTQFSGGLLANANPPPLINSAGVVNAASFLANGPLAPGSFISIFGANLSDSFAQAPTLPLPTDLNATEVLMGGRLMPLSFVSNGQINAIVPFDLAVNASHQVLVLRGSAVSLPEQVSVESSASGVFTRSNTGTGAGIVVAYHGDGSQALVDMANPASVGDVLVIYATGLGDVDPRLLAGTAPPADPDSLSHVITPVTVTIGDVMAGVQFAGPTPGYPGLYQVQAQVPAGVPTGDAVSLVLSQGLINSPPVSIAIR